LICSLAGWPRRRSPPLSLLPVSACALQWPADQGCPRGGSCSVCAAAGRLHVRMQAVRVGAASRHPTPACLLCAVHCRTAAMMRRAGTRSAACSRRPRRLARSRALQMTSQHQAPLPAKPEPWAAAQHRWVQR
jgi:hypothetical protein